MSVHTLYQRWTARISTGVVTFLVPFLASAQGAAVGFNPQTDIASWIVWAIGGLNLLVWIVFLFLNVLLDPNFIFQLGGNNAFLMMLNTVWQLSRDLMNILFALLLIGAAVYTVVTAKKDFVSQHLKNFVLAVVLVNFSWFVPRVILDVANVAASTVYSIPSLIATQQSSQACNFVSSKAVDGLTCTDESAQNNGKPRFRCQCGAVVDAQFFLSTKDAQAYQNNQSDGWSCPLGGVVCVQMENLDVQTIAGHSAVLNGLIINYARLQGLATVPANPAANSNDVSATVMFLLKEAVVLVIHIALLFPLAAILLAFAIRIPVLWLTMAFAPFYFLSLLIPDTYTGGYPKKILDEFLKAAFLPAIVGIPLTVGFIMINAGQTFVVGSLDGLKLVGFRLTDSINDFWELLWLGMTLGVIWVGVFELLGKMGIMSAGSSFLKSIGQSLGGIALKAPLAIPFLPGPAGGANISPLAAMHRLDPRSFNYALSHSDNAFGDLYKKMLGKSGGTGGGTGTGPILNNNMKDAIEKIGKNANGEQGKFVSAIANLNTRLSAGQISKNDFNTALKSEMNNVHPMPDLNADNAVTSLKHMSEQLSAQFRASGIDVTSAMSQFEQNVTKNVK